MSHKNNAIDHIAAYGCSFVYGDGINHSQSWPYVLGEKLNVPVTNQGLSGSSNKYSIIKLLDDITKNDYTNTLVIIGWTSCQRTSFYNETTKSWDNVHVSFPYNDNPALGAIVDTYFSSIYTNYDGGTILLQQQIMLQSFLEQRGIRYCFINSLSDDYAMIDFFKHADYFKRMRELVNQEKFVLGFDKSVQKLINTDATLKSADNYHPSEKGHEVVADLIFKYLKDWKLI